MPKLSDWSEPGEKPPMAGVWETKLADETEGSETYQHWNGKFYGFCSESPSAAWYMRYRRTEVRLENTCFRGLADKPEQSE